MNHKRYSGYFRKHIKTIVLVTVLMIVTTLCTFVTTQILSDVVEEVSHFKFDFAVLLVYATLLLFITVFGKFSEWGSNRLAAKVKNSITRQIHWDLASKVASATVQSIKHNNSVKLMEKMREGNNLVESISGIYMEIFTILLGIMALIYTTICSWKIAIMFLMFFIIILVVQIKIINELVKKRRKAASASDSSKQLLVEIIEGFPDVKALNLAGNLKSHFEMALNNEFHLSMKFANISANNGLYTNIILSVYQLFFLVVGAWLLYRQELNSKTFVALFMYKDYIYRMIGSILMIARNKAQIDTSTERMDEIFNEITVSKDQFGTKKLYPVKGHISIRNLSVKLGNTNAVNNLSVDITSGTFVAVVGSSGCGKSTLLNALAKQVSSSSGSIFIDGVDINELNEWSYRKAIAHVPQFPFMFSMSIKQNLLLANRNASDGEILQMLKNCSADEFIESIGGIDAVVDPGELSGGQQQRLALARIGLRGSKILLLDETTSALDSKTQDEVIKTMCSAVSKGHTLILVSHRIAPLKKADVILYMDNGKIVSSGTFSELYDNYEGFRRMVDLS